jgi:hypothetical protein
MHLLSRLSALSFLAISCLAITPAHAKWGAWQSLGGQIIGEPSLVASSIAGTPMLFVAGRGTDNALWWTQKVGNGQWTAWQSAGGIITSHPSCLSRTPGIIDCFARGKDSTMAQRSLVNGAWNDWSFPGASANPIQVGANFVAMNAGSDQVTLLSGTGGLVQMTWTPQTSWSAWNLAGIPGWEPSDGPFGCSQRVTGVNEDFVAFGKQYSNVGFEQACVAKVNTQYSLFVTAKNGGVFPLPEIASKYMPAVGISKTPQGLRVAITYTTLKGPVVKRLFTLGTGWTTFPDGSDSENLGGALSSGPSCTAKRCVGRGLDGAVWMVADE